MDKGKKTKKERGKKQEATNNNMKKSEPTPHKETSKISEIIKTVKKNSSIRLKGSRNSKVMSGKNVSEMTSSQTNVTECSEVVANSDNKSESETTSATMKEKPTEDIKNPKHSNGKCDPTDNMKEEKEYTDKLMDPADEIIDIDKKKVVKDDSTINVNKLEETKVLSDDKLMHLPKIFPSEKDRNRKLSLDHTILLRGESFSQSEVDLNSVGKLPLERKSSFFRKKMDSFLKNTSEVFRRQSVKRKGSMSLQSLPEHCGRLRSGTSMAQNVHDGSVTSISSHAVTGSEWSLNSKTQAGHQTSLAEDQASCVGSQSSLAAGQPLPEISDSTLSLNEAYHLEAYLNSRAQSVSSGLDTVTQGTRRRKANKANRVTWLASEGLTNYLRRIIQDEEGRKTQSTNQEGSICQEFRNKLDSKGRRLSYQRAVSGEDPVRYMSSLQRPLIPEHPEPPTVDLTTHLNEFSRSGVPPLRGFSLAVINHEALLWLQEIGTNTELDVSFNWEGLSQQEESRQAAIKEFIVTEVEYIKHLKAIVEVFIAAAHALQDLGTLLAVDTARLFSNIPDILNVNLKFWNMALYPMLRESQENKEPFKTDFMLAGFERFSEHFHHYEKYVGEHLQALEYLKSLKTDSEFQQFLNWCHSHKSFNRLNLSDIMIMPVQRIAKYHLILERIYSHTDNESEKSMLHEMEMNAKNYVQDINRSIRQKEEIEKLEELICTLDSYDIEFRDEEMEKLFNKYSSTNLRAPMLNCLSSESRCIIYESDLRYRDSIREARIEVRVFLLTDMILICKKLGLKSSPLLYKLIRPKYMLYKMHHITQYKNPKEISSILFLVCDDVGSSMECFQFTDTYKNPKPQLKIWDQKIKEAIKTYDLSVWAAKNPSRDISVFSESLSGTSSKSGKQNYKEVKIEREARERVAAMLYESKGACTDCDNSQVSMYTDSVEGSGGKTGHSASLRHPMFRTSTGGSSRLSSLHHSTSGASRDEPCSTEQNIYQAGSSVEHLIPPQHPEEKSTSITVTVLSESESETVVPEVSTLPSIAAAVAKITTLSIPPPQKASQKTTSKARISKTLMSRRSFASVSKRHTLKVQPLQGIMALVHSLPDLSSDPSPRPSPCPSPQTASDKLYQSHQELLQRNRMEASKGRYLAPDHRGTSYPPPSPPRGLLKRGFAFSYSIKNPPLSKMGHVNSQSALQVDAAPTVLSPSGVTVQIEDETGAVNPMLVPMPKISCERPSSWVGYSSKFGDIDPVQNVITCIPEPSQQTRSQSSASVDLEALKPPRLPPKILSLEEKIKYFSNSSFFSSGGSHEMDD